MSSPVPSTLHVISSAHRRGAQVFAAQLDEWMQRAGHRTHTVALAPGGEAPIDAEVIGSRLGFGQLRRLRSVRGDYDVAIAHGSRGLTGCALAPASQPFLYRNIGDPRHWQTGGLRATRVGFYIRRAARVLALWPGAADRFTEQFGIPASRIDVVPNAVRGADFCPPSDVERRDARAVLGLHPDKKVVAFLGSVSSEKRVSDAVRALGEKPDAQLAIAGEGPGLAQVSSLAASIGVDLVTLGVLDAPQRLLHAADALVLPSATEGMPAVLIEAGLCGLPVIATDVGAVSEVVVHGETGLLVGVGEPDRIAAGLDIVLRSGADMGAAARAHCLAFTFERVGPLVQQAVLAAA